jgi:hypothetical protein
MALLNHLRILLAASVLFAGVPVVWQHSHAGGDLAHSHAHDQHTRHQHQHHGHPHHQQHHQHGSDAGHAHLHFSLFGVEETVPLGSQEDGARDERTTFFVVAPTVMDASPVWQFAFVAAPMPRRGKLLQPATVRRYVSDCAALLPSNAHLEHSCVLLV